MGEWAASAAGQAGVMVSRPVLIIFLVVITGYLAGCWHFHRQDVREARARSAPSQATGTARQHSARQLYRERLRGQEERAQGGEVHRQTAALGNGDGAGQRSGEDHPAGLEPVAAGRERVGRPG